MKKKEWKLYAQYLQSTVDELMQTVDDLRVALADEQEAHAAFATNALWRVGKADEQIAELQKALADEQESHGECQAGRHALAMKVDLLLSVERRRQELVVENAEMKNQLNAISDIVNNAEI